MEKDRYQQNHTLYIISMISMVLSISLFCFTAYLIPYLLFGWIYDVPEFILIWQEWFKRHYEMTDFGASGLVFLIFFLLGAFTAFVAYVTSNRLENEVLHIEPENKDRATKIKRDMKETAGTLSKVVLIIILVFIAVAILEWILYVPPARY